MRNKRSDRKLREALQHPVFAELTTSVPESNDLEPLSRRSAEGDPARQALAANILSLCELINAYWRGTTTTLEAAGMLILLDIFHQQASGKSVSVTDACIASQAPATSALRSIDRLIAAGMLTRQPDPHDARRKLLTLTQGGIDRVRGYLDFCSQ